MRYYYIQFTDEGTQVRQTMSTVHSREVTKAQFVFWRELQNALVPILQLSEVCEKNPNPAVWNYPARAGTHPEPSLFYNTNTIKTWSLCIQQAKGLCVCVLNCVQLFPTSWMVTDHDHLSMGFPGKNARADCHFLLQGIFPTHGLNQHLLHWHVGSLLLNQQGIDFVKTTKSIGENSPVEYCPSGTFSISQVFQS